METGLIPPNIHFNKPRDEIRGLVEGRMKVVTESVPIPNDQVLMGKIKLVFNLFWSCVISLFVGINSFGFGGGNCHVLLRWHPKTKVNRGIPRDDMPRLVCVSGRTEQAVVSLLDSLNNNVLDAEYIKLVHDSFR